MELLPSSVMWPNILVALFIVLLAAAAHVKKTKARKMVPLPPGPWQFPILGNFHNLAGSELPHQRLAELSREYGPVMRLQLGEILMVVVSSRDAARAILKTHDLNFSDRPAILAAKEMAYNCRDIGFAPYGEYWRTMKKVCTTELLTAKRVANLRHVRDAAVLKILELLEHAGTEPVNISKHFYYIGNWTVSHATFGSAPKVGVEDFVKIMNAIVVLAGRTSLADIFPTFESLICTVTGLRRKMRNAALKMDRLLDSIIEEHMSRDVNEQKDEDKDLLDLLLTHYRLQDFDFPLSMNDIKGVVMDMFSAGTDTSGSTMEWAMVELMKHPDIMHKVQSEVRHIYHEKGKIDVDELHYFNLVIKETLRLHPPVPLLLPRLNREASEIEGYQIPARTRVLVNNWSLGRDPESWVKPNEFNPDRFQDQSLDYKGTNFEYLPFGAGRRMCPGITFGLANVEITLAKILCHFNWTLPNGMGPEDLNMDETSGLTIRKKIPLCLVATPVIPF